MKTKFGVVIFMAAILVSIAVAAAVAGNDIDQFRTCGKCGMDRKVYSYSRMLINYNNGSQSGVCSLNCAVDELKKHADSEVKSLQVADLSSQTLIDAQKAIWVMGGSKRGVMTKNPKWAFATQSAAQKFVDSSGGNISSWESVLLAARNSR